MSKNLIREDGTYDVFRVQVGNTDRKIDEIIENMNSLNLPIVNIKTLSKGSRTDHEMVLEVYVQPTAINESELKHKLNEYGGCMYQIVSVNKVEG